MNIKRQLVDINHSIYLLREERVLDLLFLYTYAQNLTVYLKKKERKKEKYQIISLETYSFVKGK